MQIRNAAFMPVRCKLGIAKFLSLKNKNMWKRQKEKKNETKKKSKGNATDANEA
jgi:hypothetical protein